MLKLNTVFGQEISVGFVGDLQRGLSLWCVDPEEGIPEPWCYITVALPHVVPLRPDEAFVRNWAEGKGIDRWLEANGIAKPTGKSIPSGFVNVPLFRFDMAKVDEHRFVF